MIIQVCDYAFYHNLSKIPVVITKLSICHNLSKIPCMLILTSLVPRLPPLTRNYCVTFELVQKSAIIARKGGEPGNEARY